MKNKDFIDLRVIMDEIFEAAEDFRKAFEEEVGSWKKPHFEWEDRRDYYPAYSYPPMNVFITKEKSLVFEFALAGFSEDDIKLEFRGDYLLFSAKAPDVYVRDESVRYFKRRLKFKDVDEQRYFVPEDRFNRDEVRAVFKNSILSITIPAKEPVKEPEGVRVTIISDGEKKKGKPAEKTEA